MQNQRPPYRYSWENDQNHAAWVATLFAFFATSFFGQNQLTMDVLDKSSDPLPQQRRVMVENPYARNHNNANPYARPPQYQYQNQTNQAPYTTPRNYGPPFMMPPPYHGHYVTPLQSSQASPYNIHQMTNSMASHYSASKDVTNSVSNWCLMV